MPLPIDTFSNRLGGFTFFKALGHPLAMTGGRNIVDEIRSKQAVVYDPVGQLPAFAALYGLTGEDFQSLLVQDALLVGQSVLGHETRPVTDLSQCDAQLLFIPVFDAERTINQMAHLIAPGCRIITLDDMRIPPSLLTDESHYLSKLNFVTNFAFFRDQGKCHTRLMTANYWGEYGASEPFLWCRLFGAQGEVLADFQRSLGPAGASLVLDSREIREEFQLGEFCGQLFVSVVGGAGHDIVKYVLDTCGEQGDAGAHISCTHDANAWPADFYAGLPAAGAGEKVLLWVQNSHPAPMPPGEVGISLMGDDTNIRSLQEELPAFASRAVDIGELFPDVRWPAQLEIHAGKWFVRPRYEVVADTNRRRINHVNVQRTDLKHDEDIRRVASLVGKGFILPAPVLPPDRYSSECLPTPMSRAQTNIPATLVVYDAGGSEVWRHSFGALPRHHQQAVVLPGASCFPSGYGHMELLYDLQVADGFLDGWLHALFRYADKQSGHGADTSFGAHMFNHLLTFRDEPQSYKGPPPGLSTKLFLRLLPPPAEVFCHLIYPLSATWHEQSTTELELKSAQGEVLTRQTIHIPAGGSRLWSCSEMFADDALRAAAGGYVTIRDASCRLFGYHGVRHEQGFALDHMFGF